jgi:molecular chaperone GrpE
MSDTVKETKQGQQEEMKKEDQAANPSPGKEMPNEGAKLEEELKKAQEEAAKWKNSYYMELADTQNLRKSLEEDHREALRYRSVGFLENLLPALDSFYIALEAKPNSEEAKNYQQGFSYIYNQIQATLKNEGVVEILPKIGDAFDPSYMHAVEVKEGDEEGKVLQVYSKGYKLHDRLIRPVMVLVSKKKVEQADDKNATEAKKA